MARPVRLVITTAQAVRGGEYRPIAWDAPAQMILTVPATSQPGNSPLVDGTTTADVRNLPSPPQFVEKPAQTYYSTPFCARITVSIYG